MRSKDIFLDSSMVEHSAVNRVVVGSSPTRGAVDGKPVNINVCRLFMREKTEDKSQKEKISARYGEKLLTENKQGLRCILRLGVLCL